MHAWSRFYYCSVFSWLFVHHFNLYCVFIQIDIQRTQRKLFDSAEGKVAGIINADTLETTSPPTQSSATQKSNRHAVLLVEDVRVSRQLARVALNKIRYRVDLAETGEDAVERFKNGQFDIVLMDIHVWKWDDDFWIDWSSHTLDAIHSLTHSLVH